MAGSTIRSSSESCLWARNSPHVSLGEGLKYIFGSCSKLNDVSTAPFRHFLAAALREGSYIATPEPRIVGHSLHDVQHAKDLQRPGCPSRNSWSGSSKTDSPVAIPKNCALEVECGRVVIVVRVRLDDSVHGRGADCD